ncbi:MAG TPA: glucosamine-6-phosphate deaminase [Clostridia bacterium]|nr:glucosamine-6-phosphate deaminase [Clostridia bacterium]
MNRIRCNDPQDLGRRAAGHTARLLREAVAGRGRARLLVSTGASQFTLFEALVQEDVDWTKVTMFHLDEYIGMPETHPASFVKYLKERFTSKVPLAAAHFIDGMGDVDRVIRDITRKIREAPVDVGLIGIGENAHIAFNDPPADFEDQDAYKVVTLNEACRRQQLGEGWFPTLEDVPRQAISMTVRQILQCGHILCAVPYKVKAQAIYDTFAAKEITPMVPATALRLHGDVTVYVDPDSAALLEA